MEPFEATKSHQRFGTSQVRLFRGNEAVNGVELEDGEAGFPVRGVGFRVSASGFRV